MIKIFFKKMCIKIKFIAYNNSVREINNFSYTNLNQKKKNKKIKKVLTKYKRYDII